MHRVAVFVDAGYLFAQGSVALTGSGKRRETLVLDAPAAVAEFKAVLATKCPNCSLLRIYWYDGSIGGNRLSAEQTLLARLDDVKVKLGFINANGQQKGVDSLIVTDMIELSRQRAICDAILLSGDEDVRIGVQVAQNYGVRVHVLGIHPARGSQSAQLLFEADTTTEWDQQIVRRFLAERVPSVPSAQAPNVGPVQPSSAQPFDQNLELAAKDFTDALPQTEIEGMEAFWSAGNRGLPSEIDKRLLPCGRSAIGRDLDNSEKRFIRGRVQNFAKDRLGQKP